MNKMDEITLLLKLIAKHFQNKEELSIYQWVNYAKEAGILKSELNGSKTHLMEE